MVADARCPLEPEITAERPVVPRLRSRGTSANGVADLQGTLNIDLVLEAGYRFLR
jgi:hypothetical protein